VELAGGNPFFLEELLAMAAEGGDAMPLTVQGVIAARLDLLPVEEKRFMQRAAVIGRTFGEEELAVVNPEGVHKRLIANLSRRDLLIALGSGWGFKHVLIRDVAYETMPRSERGRIHMQLARWLEGRRDAEPPDRGRALRVGGLAGHGRSAAGCGPDAAAGGVGGAQGVRPRPGPAPGRAGPVAANGERDRALAAEAVGDAYWMAEQLDDALDAYGQALEHGHRAGLGEHDMARLSWKWVDLPTRWGGLHLRAAPTREAIEAEIEDGLRNALSAEASVLQARLLVAKALVVWRFEHTDPPQERALEVANQALEIAERLERSGRS
jgi:hypothetical protein